MISYRTLATLWPDCLPHATNGALGRPNGLPLSRERRGRHLQKAVSAARRSSVCSGVLGSRSLYYWMTMLNTARATKFFP